MKRLTLTMIIAVAASLAVAVPAQADYGLNGLDLTFNGGDGSTASQAGSHPFSMTTTIGVETEVLTEGPYAGRLVPAAPTRDLTVSLPPGFAGDPNAMPKCSAEDFAAIDKGLSQPGCSNSTAIGVTGVQAEFDPMVPGTVEYIYAPVYNLDPPPGVAAQLGFVVLNVPITVDVILSKTPPYRVVGTLHNISQALLFYGSELTLWGNPADPIHDTVRGRCIDTTLSLGKIVSKGSCSVSVPEKPFLTLPRSCEGPLTTTFEARSWLGDSGFGTTVTHDSSEPPLPLGMTGCGKLGFGPTIVAQPTTKAASSPTGLDFSLNVSDEGLSNPSEEAVADADIRKAVVTLPEGFTTNPSVAEGLNVCSEAALARETFDSLPGVGCPNESKIGNIEVETPLLDEKLNGSLFIATPYENEVGSLIALYMVIKNPKLGIIVKQALEVEPDPLTGRLTTVAEDLPQLPFSHFKLHFREGTRSPLASPPGCGTYSASAVLTPSSGAPITTDSAFTIITGPGNGACPSGASQIFQPGLQAGTLNNAAGRYSPFNLRLTRNDGEQEFTRFSIKLPPGITGKLAGIPYCSEAAIAAAKARTGPNGGAEELASPSCPAASQVGRTLVGAGVGPSLAYAPGKVYLAGPYNGSAMSIAAITAAKVGPFDLGTVVIREALKINSETAEVFIDSTGSDPIPHIIKGVPVHARDIRAYVDRPEFMLNPTNCTRTSTASTVLGSGADFGSPLDDQPFTVTSPFQAADCASLGFAPKLALSLKGGTKRNATPAFKAVLTARPGDANIGRAQVTLPRSAFLEQGHIRTICTRVQFNAGARPGEGCPPASVYGRAKAITPLLDEPVVGPVFLRANGGDRELPDLVAALHSGQIDFNLVGFIDSAGKGQIRNTFNSAPDVPVTSFTLEMQGGKKGLIVNSVNLCARKQRALARFTGQNGKVHKFKPVVKAQCKGKKPARKGKKRGRR